MTGSMLRVPGTADLLSPEACRTGAGIFDGRLRYDLKLDFKRIENRQVRSAAITARPSSVRIYFPRRGLYPDRRDQISRPPSAISDRLRADRGHPHFWCRSADDPDPSGRRCWRPRVSSPPRRHAGAKNAVSFLPAGSFLLLPLWEKVARTQSASDEGYLTAGSVFAGDTPTAGDASHRVHLSTGGRGEGAEPKDHRIPVDSCRLLIRLRHRPQI